MHVDPGLPDPKTILVAIYAVFRFCSKAASCNQEALHKKQQRPAAWTASPLTEGEAVQSVYLWFQSNNLQWLTQH